MDPERESASQSQKSLWLPFLLGVAAAFFFRSKIRTPNQKTSKPVHPQSSSDEERENARSEASFVPYSPPAPSQNDHSDRGNDKTPAWKKTVEICVALGTFGLLIANVFLWRATKDANQISHDALVGVQRSFIAFGGVSASRFVAPVGGGYWLVEAHIQNRGNTPAEGVSFYFDGDVFPTNLISEDDFVGKGWHQHGMTVNTQSNFILGPLRKEDSFIEPEIDFQHPLKNKWPLTQFEKRNVIFRGWVIYRDVFPNTSRHLTEFCQEFTGITRNNDPKQINNPDNWTLHFGDCANHNCTDEYCPDYKTIMERVK